MATYIALLKWTPQGLQNLKESPSQFEAAGVKMKDFYMVTGRYDMIAICEAPDEGSVARALLSVTPKGSITSETCRAFTEQDNPRDYRWTRLSIGTRQARRWRITESA
jgi:uncharacterized protein with GYD domain